MKKLFFYILITVVTTNAFADEKLNKVLDELKQIKKDIKVLEKAVYSQSFKGKGSSGTSGSLEGALTRQLVKITELEEQIQKLTCNTLVSFPEIDLTDDIVSLSNLILKCDLVLTIDNTTAHL